jgi:hypothetical protein
MSSLPYKQIHISKERENLKFVYNRKEWEFNKKNKKQQLVGAFFLLYFC